MEDARVTPIQVNQRKPYVTYALLGINIAVFLVEMALEWSGMRHGEMLLRMGAKENTLITLGQYWRLLSATFLHADWQHILFNMVALYIWGPHLEALLGRCKMLVVYIVSGVLGSLASYVFSLNVAVGASGSIFGCFGALLYFRTRHKQIFNQVFGLQVLVLIGMNLVNGFIIPGVDNYGHIGGLLGGFAMSLATGLYREKPSAVRVLALLGVIALCAGLFLIGMFRYSRALGVPMFTFLS